MCGIKYVIFAGQSPQVGWRGRALTKHAHLTSGDVWAEFPCNLGDPHPRVGQHSYTDKSGAVLTWAVPEDDSFRAADGRIIAPHG